MGFFDKIKRGLTRTKESLIRNIESVVIGYAEIDDDFLEDLEMVLLSGDIGVRTTTIEDAGGNRKIVNNSDIRNVQNRSRKDSYAVSKVSVSYDTKMSRLREVFDAHRQEIFERNSDVFEDMPNFNGIQEFQDSGILLHFSVKVAEKDIFRAQRVLNGELKELFDANGIEIPFPQVVVHKQQT